MNPSLTDGGANSAPEPPAPIAGDRGPAWVKRGASVQSKVQNALALAVVALLGGGFLTWYYTGLAAKPVAPEQTKAKQAAQGEMKLPPLGPAPVKAKPEQSRRSWRRAVRRRRRCWRAERIPPALRWQGARRPGIRRPRRMRRRLRRIRCCSADSTLRC